MSEASQTQVVVDFSHSKFFHQISDSEKRTVSVRMDELMCDASMKKHGID